LTQIDGILKSAGLDSTQQDQAMALCLKQMNHLSEGKLENHIINEIAAEKDAQKVSRFTQLLDLLYKPIEWVLSGINALLSSKSSEKVTPTVQVEEPIVTQEAGLSKSRIFGLFSRQEEGRKSPVKTVESPETLAQEADKTEEHEHDAVEPLSSASTSSM